ncbi:MAG TPA: Ig-like domain-containing protein [Parasegetibacter sp.]
MAFLIMVFNLIPLRVEGASNTILPFILRKTNFAFEERVDALIIDAGKEVIGSSLSVSDFETHVRSTRIVDPNFVAYDGPREIIDVYVSQVNDIGYPSDTGRYIIIDFHDVGWGDGGTTTEGGYTLDSQYTITYKGSGIKCVDGSIIIPQAFEQVGAVSPVLDKYRYDNYDGLDYSYFLNEDVQEPLPLVVFFHGGGQGNDIYTPIRFSNGGTVWANPENQAKYPCHVLAPRNAITPADMEKVKGIIDQMIADGKVDPNRIYITGFSMGGASTWTFLRTFPEVPAAAAPLCPAGGPRNADEAKAVAYLPLWTFVDAEDFLLNFVVGTYETYSQYWYDSMLTVLPESRLYEPPYNGWKFAGHSVWLPVYNEYTHPERGKLIDWFFSKSKIRGIADVSVQTVSGVAPVLPETVTVYVNYNATGIKAEERSVVWEAIDPNMYGNDGPGVFTVRGTIEGCVEKAMATVIVEYRNRIDDLKEMVKSLALNGGNKNALTVKLDNAEKFISQSKPQQAVNMLNAFINQVNGFRNAGKLAEGQAVEMIEAARETIRNITS